MSFGRFQFNQQFVFDKQINAKSFIQHNILIFYLDRLLPINFQVQIGKRLGENRFVHALQQPGTETDMQLMAAFDGDRRQLFNRIFNTPIFAFFATSREKIFLFASLC